MHEILFLVCLLRHYVRFCFYPLNFEFFFADLFMDGYQNVIFWIVEIAFFWLILLYARNVSLGINPLFIS